MSDFTIDWLSCTFPHPEHWFDLEPLMLQLWGLNTARGAMARHGYTVAISNDAGMVLQSSERPAMGTNLVCTGQSLSDASELLPDFLNRLQHVLLHAKTVSRLDVAIDVKPGGMVRRLANLCKADMFTSHARKWYVIESAAGGLTLYIGSRESERMLRIYDKSAEQGMCAGLWDRIELEVKDKAALRLARALATQDMQAIIKGWITDFCDFPDNGWKVAMAEGQSNYVPSQRKATDTREWLLNDVARVVAKHIVAGDTALGVELAIAVQAYLDNPP